MLQCGPSDRTFAATAKSGGWRIYSLRDFSDIRFSHFADAAFPRACGMLVAAMQHMSPKRPFNRDIVGQIQTVLSLRDAGTNKRRDFPDLGLFQLNGWFRRFATGPYFRLQHEPDVGLSRSRRRSARSRHSADVQQFWRPDARCADKTAFCRCSEC